MTDMVEKIADCLVEDHVDLLRENERLRKALIEIRDSTHTTAVMLRAKAARALEEK